MFQRLFSLSPKPVRQNRFTKFQKKLNFDDSLSESKISRTNYGDFHLRFLVILFATFLISTACCHLPYHVIVQFTKALGIGVIAVYLSWEVVYFDSTTPGISPPVPLSPRAHSKKIDYTMHTSYLFPVLSGVLFSVMAYMWL